MAMLRLMQYVTEHPGWDRAILDCDEAQLAQWHQDATEGPEGFLISSAVWNWCLEELRDKVEMWQKTQRLLVFDSSSTLCQAKVSGLEGIKEEVAQLGSQPNHDTPLVDPSLFPLMYDRSPVLVHGGRVSLENLWGLAGEVAGVLPPHPLDLMGRRRISLSRRPVGYKKKAQAYWGKRDLNLVDSRRVISPYRKYIAHFPGVFSDIGLCFHES
ncbi:hypothetical protein BO94DRAFT_583353 [Aspergillus sclerotioniger CBS 115572]|uniref:DUF4246 domain-containing protein n=1 Tax=Aspergillus sclerotioniger CBS 115572 TaxID=1450535 RepID=A0A317X652_9EURO|nr:hypothetical protein BO94DRAFT_583353 [Aspergillus sclerotioniger CBS 115572]PWY93112.1 hypothetical protein BO94DRAFT_583353 [Aspergillus sclerotioniger CBS 115572]